MHSWYEICQHQTMGTNSSLQAGLGEPVMEERAREGCVDGGVGEEGETSLCLHARVGVCTGYTFIPLMKHEPVRASESSGRSNSATAFVIVDASCAGLLQRSFVYMFDVGGDAVGPSTALAPTEVHMCAGGVGWAREQAQPESLRTARSRGGR